ncbi:DUF6473 family protein [Aliiglaciecola aliphaticivorans]
MLYQVFDYECFDYNLWFESKLGILRGPDPRPLTDGEYVSVLGSAHSFGRFVEKPFPEQIQNKLNIKVLNMSTSAVGPRYFYEKDGVLEYANKSKICIVQAVSGRSCGNSEYTNENTKNNIFQKISEGPDAPLLSESNIYGELFKAGDFEKLNQYFCEMKETWVKETIELGKSIKTESVFLWFSSRSPKYDSDTNSYDKMIGEFPQLVDDLMVEQVKPYFDHYVEVISREGLPVPFYNKFTNCPSQCFFGRSYRNSHPYYPSQEMNDLVFEKLEPIISKTLKASNKENVSVYLALRKRSKIHEEEGEGGRIDFLERFMPELLDNCDNQLVIYSQKVNFTSLLAVKGISLTASLSVADFIMLDNKNFDFDTVNLNAVLWLDNILGDSRCSLQSFFNKYPKYKIICLYGKHALVCHYSVLEEKLKMLHRAFIFNRNPKFKLSFSSIHNISTHIVTMRSSADFNIDHYEYVKKQKVIL